MSLIDVGLVSSTTKRIVMDLKNLTFLVVEDQPSMRAAICFHLKQIGVKTTVEATDGLAALTRLSQGGIDFVISDIHMPQMDGLTLLRRIKGADPTKDVPVLIITSSPEATFMARAAKYGAEGYLLKEALISSLEQKILTILRNQAKKSQTQSA